MDIKDFFLKTILPKEDREYFRIHHKYFDDDLINHYKLRDKIADDGYIYCEILKWIYRLKQAAILAYMQLKQQLEKWIIYGSRKHASS